MHRNKYKYWSYPPSAPQSRWKCEQGDTGREEGETSRPQLLGAGALISPPAVQEPPTRSKGRNLAWVSPFSPRMPAGGWRASGQRVFWLPNRSFSSSLWEMSLTDSHWLKTGKCEPTIKNYPIHKQPSHYEWESRKKYRYWKSKDIYIWNI